jgi:hypothetical protein
MQTHFQYAEYWQVYILHILHIYAPPTLLMVGLANYYRKFVLRFSALAAPLTALCSPRATFRWGPAEQTSCYAA